MDRYRQFLQRLAVELIRGGICLFAQLAVLELHYKIHARPIGSELRGFLLQKLPPDSAGASLDYRPFQRILLLYYHGIRQRCETSMDIFFQLSVKLHEYKTMKVLL